MSGPWWTARNAPSFCSGPRQSPRGAELRNSQGGCHESAVPREFPRSSFLVVSLSQAITAFVLIPEQNAAYEMVIRSTNNLPEAKTLLAAYLNIRDLLGFDKVVMPLQSLDVITLHLG